MASKAVPLLEEVKHSEIVGLKKKKKKKTGTRDKSSVPPVTILVLKIVQKTSVRNQDWLLVV